MPKRLWILAAIALLVGGVAAMSNAGGDMPAFPDIGEENLSALTAYLKTL